MAGLLTYIIHVCSQVGNAEVLNLEDRGGQDQNYRYNRATQWQPQSIDGRNCVIFTLVTACHSGI